jgi:membrane fusion protein (multidrug efflux system)
MKSKVIPVSNQSSDPPPAACISNYPLRMPQWQRRINSSSSNCVTRILPATCWAVLVVCIAVAPALAQVGPAGGGAAGPVQVGVVTVHPQPVPITTELPGRVDASQLADVRPQVGGVIKSINFKAGQLVKAGDVLYQIDDAVYQAQVQVQAAAVQKAQAAVNNAQAQLTSDQALANTSNLSQSALQTAQLTLAQAQADLASAQASLKSAQINESYTRVVAPISGLISDTSVTQGTLVTAGQTTALATVRLLDPAYVALLQSSDRLLRLRAEFASGALTGGPRANGGQADVHLILEDGSNYPQAGSLTLQNVVVSQTTGTFSIRATFPNPQQLLLPGMFVRATVDLGTEPNVYLVPQVAVSFDTSGQATAFLVEGGKAVSHTLSTGQNIGSNWLVTAGLYDGAKVVVDGLQKVSNGSAVTPVEVTINQNGVAQAAAATPQAGTSGNLSPPAAATPAAKSPAATPATPAAQQKPNSAPAGSTSPASGK